MSFSAKLHPASVICFGPNWRVGKCAELTHLQDPLPVFIHGTFVVMIGGIQDQSATWAQVDTRGGVQIAHVGIAEQERSFLDKAQRLGHVAGTEPGQIELE